MATINRWTENDKVGYFTPATLCSTDGRQNTDMPNIQPKDVSPKKRI